MNPIKVRILYSLISILVIPAQILAATYYAAPKGSLDLDNNTSGTGSGTEGSPWSVGQAMVEAAAGDTVYFRGGHYYAGQSNNDGNLLALDFDDTDTPGWVKVTVRGYYLGDVN